MQSNTAKKQVLNIDAHKQGHIERFMDLAFDDINTVKKGLPFPVPSRDVTDQTLPGRE
jgi:hypothetical protein